MVRLKDRFNTSASVLYFISIPYGAIKRYEQITSERGAFIFQFLMVRLKAPNLWTDALSTKRISIPYGAIKRLVVLIVYTPFQLFQFLMVRLKDDF